MTKNYLSESSSSHTGRSEQILRPKNNLFAKFESRYFIGNSNESGRIKLYFETIRPIVHFL